jgi:hypothetical protein
VSDEHIDPNLDRAAEPSTEPSQAQPQAGGRWLTSSAEWSVNLAVLAWVMLAVVGAVGRLGNSGIIRVGVVATGVVFLVSIGLAFAAIFGWRREEAWKSKVAGSFGLFLAACLLMGVSVARLYMTDVQLHPVDLPAARMPALLDATMEDLVGDDNRGVVSFSSSGYTQTISWAPIIEVTRELMAAVDSERIGGERHAESFSDLTVNGHGGFAMRGRAVSGDLSFPRIELMWSCPDSRRTWSTTLVSTRGETDLDSFAEQVGREAGCHGHGPVDPRSAVLDELPPGWEKSGEDNSSGQVYLRSDGEQVVVLQRSFQSLLGSADDCLARGTVAIEHFLETTDSEMLERPTVQARAAGSEDAMPHCQLRSSVLTAGEDAPVVLEWQLWACPGDAPGVVHAFISNAPEEVEVDELGGLEPHEGHEHAEPLPIHRRLRCLEAGGAAGSPADPERTEP